jgi:hypothetical protein
LVIIMMLMMQSVYSQTNDVCTNEQEVRAMISDFNKILLSEMNTKKALKTHYNLGKVDKIDLKYGLESFFLRGTKEVTKKNKLRNYSAEFYFDFALPLIRMRLGKELVEEKTVFIDGELAEDKELSEPWDKLFIQSGLKDSSRDRPNPSNIKSFELLVKNLNSVIARKTNEQLVIKNLVFIDEHLKIKKEIFEGREYFKLENKLFHYTVAIKNGVPKIMYINRA